MCRGFAVGRGNGVDVFLNLFTWIDNGHAKKDVNANTLHLSTAQVSTCVHYICTCTWLLTAPHHEQGAYNGQPICGYGVDRARSVNMDALRSRFNIKPFVIDSVYIMSAHTICCGTGSAKTNRRVTRLVGLCGAVPIRWSGLFTRLIQFVTLRSAAGCLSRDIFSGEVSVSHTLKIIVSF